MNIASAEANLADELQTARAVLMIRPASFAVNPQTAASNAYQQINVGDGGAISQQALAETEQAARRLAAAGVEVILMDDIAAPAKPDAVFPNNWVSFHGDVRVIIYPLHAVNRRLERRPELIGALVDEYGYAVTEQLDLSRLEALGISLEGTGSLVFDRPRRLAFAALSPRTHPEGIAEFSRQADYTIISFHTRDRGQSVYHTNVMLALGTRFAVICDQVIADAVERSTVLASLEASGRELIFISRQQMSEFAANLLEISTPTGPVIALSARALASLDAAQRRRLEAHGQLIAPAIDAIESGGGSLRCMLAEIFLPRVTSGPG